ncbi:MAG: ATPase domain-containing protein [archaeon]|jgi:circadian clock protein KaiC
MPNENVYVPGNASQKSYSEAGFSVKLDPAGSMQIKNEKDALESDSVTDSFNDREIIVKRVNEGNDDSRVRTGVKGFDELIGGGFERESIVLLVGASGTGKTILSMQFLYKGIKEYDEPGVLLSFEEERDQLFKHANQFGWDFEKLEKEDKFRLLVFKPHQVTKILEEGGGQIRDALAEVGAKRIVVDSITAYGLLFRDEYKRREKVLEFFNLLRKWGVTSLVVCEDSPKDVEEQEGSIGFISDAIVSLYYDQDSEKGIRVHSLEVLKMRGTKHTNKVCAVNFEEEGITVYPDVEVF